MHKIPTNINCELKQNEIQTQQFANNDRAKSTQSRNKVQSRKFALYAVTYYQSPDTDPKIRFIQDNK